jgi:hypothetical protein
MIRTPTHTPLQRTSHTYNDGLPLLFQKCGHLFLGQWHSVFGFAVGRAAHPFFAERLRAVGAVILLFVFLFAAVFVGVESAGRPAFAQLHERADQLQPFPRRLFGAVDVHQHHSDAVKQLALTPTPSRNHHITGTGTAHRHRHKSANAQLTEIRDRDREIDR